MRIVVPNISKEKLKSSSSSTSHLVSAMSSAVLHWLPLCWPEHMVMPTMLLLLPPPLSVQRAVLHSRRWRENVSRDDVHWQSASSSY